MRGRGRRQTWLWAVWLVSAAVLLVGAVLEQRWLWLSAAVAVGLLYALLTRGRAEPEPAQDWDDERVRAVVAAAGSRHVAAVKAVREQDPALSLQAADALVRRVTGRA